MSSQIVVFLLNGVGTLILETVWLKKHIAIFGSSPEAYGSILFSYFLGISAGSYYYRRNRRSLRGFYAGFAGALLLSLCLPVVVLDRLPLPAEFVYGHPLLYKSVVWTLAMLAIVPACFFLGGFFPLISRTVNQKGFVFLYGIQALGAAIGLYLGCFLLPYSVGYLITFLFGIAVNLASLFFLRRSFGHPVAGADARPEEEERSLRFGTLAFFSGFLSLVIQVLWIRFIALATDNSIYAFGSASLIILLQLTVSSYLTSRLPESWFRNSSALTGLLFLAFVGIVVSTEVYVRMTGGLAIKAVGNAAGLFASLGFAASFISIGYCFMSFVFPFIMRMAKSTDVSRDSAGLGMVIALNGIGCALGSIVGSFFLLPRLGMWMSLMLALIGYAVFLLVAGDTRLRFGAAAFCGALLLLLSPLRHPLVTPVDSVDNGPDGSLVSVKEGKYGIVSAIEYRRGLTLWLNNTYQLEAGKADVRGPYRMGLLPTVLNPTAKTLAMIGIGTGISSKGFLNSRIDRIRLIEMVPEVAEAAATHFRQYNGNVLADPRVKTIIDDGRHYLAIGTDTFDIISSDLFTPWNEGTAYLYTVDHFRNAKKRLSQDGLFCLWLPLFQMTREEFLIIAKSFASVFPHTTVWQLSWGLDDCAVALVGKNSIDTEALRHYMNDLPFPDLRPDLMQTHISGIFCSYVGPVILTEDVWEHVPLNTLDLPIIEFKTAQRDRLLLKGKELLDLFDLFFHLEGNPGQGYFTQYDESLEAYRMAGRDLNRASFYSAIQDHAQAAYFSDKGISIPAFVLYKQVLSSWQNRPQRAASP